MSSVLSVLGKTAGVLGKGFEGYGVDQATKVRQTLAEQAAKREEEDSRVRRLVGNSQIRENNARASALETPAEKQGSFHFDQSGKPYEFKNGKLYEVEVAKPQGPAVVAPAVVPPPAVATPEPVSPPQDHAPAAPAKPVETPRFGPKPTTKEKFIWAAKPDGSTVLLPESEVARLGLPKAQPLSSGSAAIQKSIADNATSIAAIDKAIALVEQHPTAFGLARGGASLLPGIGNMLGGAQEAVNQRLDPEGQDARSMVSNIGSLILHDRSGAAVTVGEFPRLTPFIPGIADTPDKILKNLRQLKELAAIETNALQEGVRRSSGREGGAPATAKPSITSAEANALKAQGFTDAQIQAKYTVTP